MFDCQDPRCHLVKDHYPTPCVYDLDDGPTATNTGMWACDNGFTHHQPDCNLAANPKPCTWETRGDIACFACFDIGPINANGTTIIDRAPSGPGGPSNGQPREQLDRTEPAPFDEMVEWLGNLGRKVTVDEVDGPRLAAAEAWLLAWTGDFEFLVEMQGRINKFGNLTRGQAKGVLNCWRADVLRSQRKPKNPGRSTGLDLSAVPSGRYMASNGHRYQIDNLIGDESAGKWTGWVFVKQGSEYGNRERLGRQTPGGTYEGRVADVIAEIAKDPAEAMARYGQNTGRCGRCERVLEDKESRRLGIGPVCRTKFSLAA